MEIRARTILTGCRKPCLQPHALQRHRVNETDYQKKKPYRGLQRWYLGRVGTKQKSTFVCFLPLTANLHSALEVCLFFRLGVYIAISGN